MKKLNKLLAAAAALVLAASMISCGDPDDPTTDSPKTPAAPTFQYPANAIPLQLQKKTPGESNDSPNLENADSVQLGADCSAPFAVISQDYFTAEECPVNSKIYFTVTCAEGQNFRVQNWSWADVVTKIYDAKTNEAISPTFVEDEQNGNHNDYSVTGTYYLIVDSDALSKLAQSLEFHGNKATFTKFAIVKAPVAD